MWHAASEFDDVDAALDLATGIGKDLAVLLSDRSGQGFLVFPHQAQEFVHQTGPTNRRHVSPGRKRRLGGRHGHVDIHDLGQHHLAGDLSGGRVGHGLAASGLASAALSVDVMGDLGGHFGRLQQSYLPTLCQIQRQITNRKIKR